MNTIKRSEVEREKEILQEISESKTMKVAEKYEAVEKLGYEFHHLGASRCAYTRAHEVRELHINSKRYLDGNYLCYGTYNVAYGHCLGVIYRGYVKEIIDDVE